MLAGAAVFGAGLLSARGRPPRNALTGNIPLKRIFTTLIQLGNLVAIEAIFSDLLLSAKCPDCGHLLDCKSDSLGSRGDNSAGEL
jgi:hypothetical protein